jgi:hypothetical protein
MRRRRGSESGAEALPAWDESTEEPHAPPPGGGDSSTSLARGLSWPSPRVSQAAPPSRNSSASSTGGGGPGDLRVSWAGLSADRRLSWAGGSANGAGAGSVRGGGARNPRESRERRRSSSVDLLADGLLRQRYHAHLSTQVLLAALAPAVWFAWLAAGGGGGSGGGGASGGDRAKAAALLLLFVSLAAAAVRHKLTWCAPSARAGVRTARACSACARPGAAPRADTPCPQRRHRVRFFVLSPRRQAPSWARPRAERAVSRLVRLGVAAVALATVACAWDALPGGRGNARFSSHDSANESAYGSAAHGAVGGGGGAAAGARAAIFYFLGPHAFFASVWVTLQVRIAARARAHARRSAVGTLPPLSFRTRAPAC